MIRKQKGLGQQLYRISEILKISLQDSQSSCQPIFKQEEKSIARISKSFQENLMATKQVIFKLDFKKIYVQMRKKIQVLSKIFFHKDIAIESLKFKHRRLQRFLRLAKTKSSQIPLKISTQKIKRIFQNQSKLSMSPDLFILKCYLSQSVQNQKYSYEDDPLQLIQNECLDDVILKFKIIHTYRPEQAEKIISSSIPSLQYYKSSYQSIVNSEDIKYFKRQNKQSQQDEESITKKCCKYLKYSMELDFLKSLVKQQDTQKYIQRFSIIENKAICQGLIVGALWGIPKTEDPDFSDSEKEQEWEDKRQSLIRQLCKLFQGYFEAQEDNKQLSSVIARIALLQQQNNRSLFEYLDNYWLK